MKYWMEMSMFGEEKFGGGVEKGRVNVVGLNVPLNSFTGAI